MKPVEHNTQGINPIQATEPRRLPDDGHREASSVPVSSGHPQPLSSPANLVPTEEELFRLIASNYLRTTPPKCKDDRDEFKSYLKEMRVLITGASVGSLLITVKCDSLEVLEGLWEDYSSGHLGKVVQKCFVTEEILKELNLAELKLKTTISEEEYKACKVYFEEKG